jgi:hypothetical protein
MPLAERHEAIAVLKRPDLVDWIIQAFPTCGLAGEGLNSLSAYLACTSRKLGHPLAVIIQSTSAAGKSTVMEAVLAMFPEEERIKYSAMTGQSLYYLGETHHRQHRQGSADRPHGNPGIPCRRPGHDLPDHDGRGDR